jgi:hypothetical protein
LILFTLAVGADDGYLRTKQRHNINGDPPQNTFANPGGPSHSNWISGPRAQDQVRSSAADKARPGLYSSGYCGRVDHPDQVAGYVARTVLGEVTAPESLAARAWSTAYALTVAGQAMVLRVSRYGGDFAKDEAVSAVVGDMLPVPAITARGAAHGWAYAVSALGHNSILSTPARLVCPPSRSRSHTRVGLNRQPRSPSKSDGKRE